MQAQKILHIPSPSPVLQKQLRQELGISEILAQLLINRGITGPAEATAFLEARLDSLIDPFTFSQMSKAVELVKKAASRKHRVMIFGDYDVDGVTALALLKTTLSKMGIDAISRLPHRLKEGYGLSKNIVRLAEEKGVKLLITVDCGTSSYQEIAELRERGIDVIVTDHHEPASDRLPEASAIINPKVKSSRYPFKDLAGVGVAYKFCQAISDEDLAEDLDLVSLGTIADVVPLTGENRVLVKEGLARISNTRRPGLEALLELSGIKNKKITSTFVSYIIGPRLNASGRMDTADITLQLILSDSKHKAQELARLIESYNRQRQKTENKIMEEAQHLIDKEINFKKHKVIVLAKEDWHHGVLGIVASKLADRFYRPTILISLSEGVCKGSGRSIRNFHLFHALVECRQFLSNFGGHAHAVGLVITKDNIAEFREKINLLAEERLRIEDLLPRLDVDMEVDFGDLNEGIIAELAQLEPFGTGNPEPLLYSRNLSLKGDMQVLGRETLKFWVTDGTVTFQAIGFGMSYFKESLEGAKNFSLVYTPRMDSWRGDDSLILEAKDIFLG